MSVPLFEPIGLRNLRLANRVMVSPMCQYSAVEGCATDWHLVHLGQFLVSGAGLVCMEMTNVEARGRISPRCAGLYDDACERSLEPVLSFARAHGNAPLAIQLAHAGRKASTRAPWEGREPLLPGAGGWEPVAPSAVASGEGLLTPRALESDEVGELPRTFVRSVERAARAGFDAVELHMAHGYLLHQFLSPLSNRREDAYGGSLEKRMRLPLAVFEAARAAWPEDRPMGVRVSATDWAEGGWGLEDTIAFCRTLAELGCDWFDVSGGGLVSRQRIPTGPGYQVPFAEAVRKATGVPTVAVGMITEPAQANAIVAEGRADIVALARGMLHDPRWLWHAAEALGVDLEPAAAYPNQYLRARLEGREDVFADRGRRKTA